MSMHAATNRAAKAVFGAAVMAAAVAAAVMSAMPKPRPVVSREILERRIGALPGFAGVLSLTFDGVRYNGQGAAMLVAIDVGLRTGSDRAAAESSMREAGGIIREAMDVYRKIVVTGYKSAKAFEGGLAFRSRAVWLAPELAEPLDGWIVVRLPDELREPARSLEGIYAKPEVVSAGGGALAVRLDLATESPAHPAADLMEILVLPLIDTVDYDNVFDRSPGLKSLEVAMVSGRDAARFVMTRDEYQATDVDALLARLSKKALKISQAETAIAEKYMTSELFTPLLFDSVVSEEDKAQIREFEAERRSAQDEFYAGLFAKGTLEVGGKPQGGQAALDAATGAAHE